MGNKQRSQKIEIVFEALRDNFERERSLKDGYQKIKEKNMENIKRSVLLRMDIQTKQSQFVILFNIFKIHNT